MVSQKKILKVGLLGGIVIFFITIPFANRMDRLYLAQPSIIIRDRHGEEILIKPNNKEHYARFLQSMPEGFQKLLIQKEDHFFFFHPGINPVSIVRDVFGYLQTGTFSGSSTLTQQVVKNALGNENERSVKNKLVESLYTLALELHRSKRDILAMYANTASLGKGRQGIEEAARYYFGKMAVELTPEENLSLIATLSNPSRAYPGTERNKMEIKKILERGILQTSNNSLLSSRGVAERRVSGRHPGIVNDRGDPLRNTKIASVASLTRNDNTRRADTFFELSSIGIDCTASCALTIDQKLTEKLRAILRRNIESPSFASVMNGAIVVLKTTSLFPPSAKGGRNNGGSNELLAIVGSPNPDSKSSGYQINMAIHPRPLGSTVKPFIYLKAFEQGARSYTLVEDQEYKYTIGTGFPFYPKNYDGQYRGTVTLHEALSNSLNVPSVKVLEYVGLPDFYDFLENKLQFQSLQPLENYELGVALGGLEMDLLTLVNYFTIFPNEGTLKPLATVIPGLTRDPETNKKTKRSFYFPFDFLGSPDTSVEGNDKKEKNVPQFFTPPMSSPLVESKRITDPKYVQLVNRILSDQISRVDQFGLKSNLTLQSQHYAVKTGTSRDFRDSWTIGYTPDFVVGVWIGNHDNTPMFQVSGQAGAGKIWHEVMEVLLNSEYNQNREFDFSFIKEFQGLPDSCHPEPVEGSSNVQRCFDKLSMTKVNTIEYGLPGDDYQERRLIMQQNFLILSPHDGDVFLFEPQMTISLKAKEEVEWSINGKYFGIGSELSWRPEKEGEYEIQISKGGNEEKIEIIISKEEPPL